MPARCKNGFSEFYLETTSEMDQNKCKENCKLYQIFSDYLIHAGTKGEIDIINRLKRENRELRSKIHQIKNGDD